MKTCFVNNYYTKGVLVVLATLALAVPAFAHQGTVTKYLQRPGYLVNPNDMMLAGENIWSDVDWNKVMIPQPSPTVPPLCCGSNYLHVCGSHYLNRSDGGSMGV